MRIDLRDINQREISESFRSAPRRKGRGKDLFKFFGCSFVTIVIIVAIGYITLRFLVGPIVKTVGNLPSDFPTEFAIHSLDDASIKLQTPESREKIIEGLKSMPDWLLNIFLSALSDDLKTQLIDNFGEQINIPKNFSIDDLKKALEGVNIGDAKTVSLSWDGIAKTKEELASIYKNKLAESDFEFKEKLEDYKINLGFWKDGIFGTIVFEDDRDDSGPEVQYNSDVDIMINYFNKQ